MTEYFERIWTAVPVGAEPEHYGLRRDYLLSRITVGDRVLDVGCGAGEFSRDLARAGARVTGVDVAAEPLRRAAEREPRVELQLVRERLPFDDGSFDTVWAGELLEHVQDLPRLLDELVRVLRSGGRLLVSTPDHPRSLAVRLALSRRAFEEHFDPRSDHVRFFTRRTLAAVVEAAGFEDVEVRSASGVLLASAVRP